MLSIEENLMNKIIKLLLLELVHLNFLMVFEQYYIGTVETNHFNCTSPAVLA